jgi:hypothetical protein
MNRRAQLVELRARHLVDVIEMRSKSPGLYPDFMLQEAIDSLKLALETGNVKRK